MDRKEGRHPSSGPCCSRRSQHYHVAWDIPPLGDPIRGLQDQRSRSLQHAKMHIISLAFQAPSTPIDHCSRWSSGKGEHATRPHWQEDDVLIVIRSPR